MHILLKLALSTELINPLEHNWLLFDNFLLNTAFYRVFNGKKLTKNAQIYEIKCIASNYDIITAWNHDVTTLNDEKHLDESCSKISENYHSSKKRYSKFNPKSCQTMEIAK